MFMRYPVTLTSPPNCTCHTSVISLSHYDSASAHWTCIIPGVISAFVPMLRGHDTLLGTFCFFVILHWLAKCSQPTHLSLSHLVCISLIFDPKNLFYLQVAAVLMKMFMISHSIGIT